MSTEYKKFLISYPYDGGRWNIEMAAADFDDAVARLKAMQWGKVDGEVIAKIPAHSGWIAALAVWVRNACSSLQARKEG